MRYNISQVKDQNKNNGGYTLPEVMAVVFIIGVLAIIANPAKSWFENPVGNGTNKTVGILNLTRMRAISTTSAYRIRPDPSAPTSKFKIEIAKTRGCESTTKLTEDALATDTELKVASASGFVVGDSIKVGSDSENNEIIATDASNITLGQEIGSAQLEDAPVELKNNWLNDSNFNDEDLTLPKEVKMSAIPTDWTLCFDSRGLANLYDEYGKLSSNFSLSLINVDNQQKSIITVFKGGSIQVK